MNQGILRFGLIGAGYFGKHYVRLLGELPGVSLSAVATNKAEADALLARSDIDCIVIATPASTHFEYIMRSLESGRHVLVEKPMIAPGDDAAALREAVRKSDRIVTVGHQYLYNDYVLHLKKELDRDVLGRVRYIFAEHFYFGPVRFDIGCFWETAVHELAMIDYLFIPGAVKEVSASATLFMRDGRDDFSSVSLSFEKGPRASLVTSWFAPEKIRRMTIAGDKGFAVFDDVAKEDKLKFYFAPYPSSPGGNASHFFDVAARKVVVPKIRASEPLRNELEHFIECVRTGASPRTGIAHGMRVTEMLEKINSKLKIR